MRAEEMETLVCILCQHQAGEKPGRFFRWARAAFLLTIGRRRLFVSITPLLDILQWLEVHLAIRAVQKRELAREPIAKKVAGDFTRFINLRQRKSRERQTSRRAR